MIDAIAHPNEIATLHVASARYASMLTARMDAPPAQPDPDAPAGPRPSFAVTTLEQLRASQSVAAVMTSLNTSAAPDGTSAPPVAGTMDRFL